MTQGGPGEATSTISVFLYRQTFVNARWGYASAAAIIVLILISVAAMRAIRPLEVAQEESLEELVTAETPAELRVEDAIEAEARA
jgi:ABC-type sugar transport system permease subunit